MLCVYTVCIYIYILVHAACGEVQRFLVLHTPGKTQDIARLGTYKLAVSFHSRILVSEALKKLAKSQHSCGLYPQFCEVTNRHNRLHF